MDQCEAPKTSTPNFHDSLWMVDSNDVILPVVHGKLKTRRWPLLNLVCVYCSRPQGETSGISWIGASINGNHVALEQVSGVWIWTEGLNLFQLSPATC